MLNDCERVVRGLVIREAVPKGVDVYEVAGQSVFPIYSKDGGLLSSYMVYLTLHPKFDGGNMGLGGLSQENTVYGVQIVAGDSEETIKENIEKGVSELLNVQHA